MFKNKYLFINYALFSISFIGLFVIVFIFKYDILSYIYVSIVTCFMGMSISLYDAVYERILYIKLNIKEHLQDTRDAYKKCKIPLLRRAVLKQYCLSLELSTCNDEYNDIITKESDILNKHNKFSDRYWHHTRLQYYYRNNDYDNFIKTYKEDKNFVDQEILYLEMNKKYQECIDLIEKTPITSKYWDLYFQYHKLKCYEALEDYESVEKIKDYILKYDSDLYFVNVILVK